MKKWRRDSIDEERICYWPFTSQNGGCNSTCATCIYHIDFHQKTGRKEVPWRPILNVAQYLHRCITNVQIVTCWKKYLNLMTLIFSKDRFMLLLFLLFSDAHYLLSLTANPRTLLSSGRALHPSSNLSWEINLWHGWLTVYTDVPYSWCVIGALQFP